jgi:predicted CXXCH cytochrome family protein
MYDTIQPASFSGESSFAGRRSNNNLDPISKECISCHDGVLAKEAKHRISSGYQQRTMSIETIRGAHPVGMDYDQYRWNKQYVPATTFPAAMVLMDGKVTCVTCHNLLGENTNYLVVDNDKSGLCFTCHIK